MKCETCRKKNVELTSWWERLKFKVMEKLFSKELIDFNQEKHTQGFGDGYKMGMKHCQEMVQESKKMLDEIYKGDLTPEVDGLYGEVSKTQTKEV
jgi:hypothetical protein